MIGTWRQVKYELKQPAARLLVALFAFSTLHMLVLFLPGANAQLVDGRNVQLGHLLTTGFVVAYAHFLVEFGQTAVRRVHDAIEVSLARHAVVLLKHQVNFVAVLVAYVQLRGPFTALTGLPSQTYDILFLLVALHPIAHIGLNITRYLNEYTDFIMTEIQKLGD